MRRRRRNHNYFGGVADGHMVGFTSGFTMTSNESSLNVNDSGDFDSVVGAMSGRSKRTAASNYDVNTPKKAKLANADTNEAESTGSKKRGKSKWCGANVQTNTVVCTKHVNVHMLYTSTCMYVAA